MFFIQIKPVMIYWNIMTNLWKQTGGDVNIQ